MRSCFRRLRGRLREEGDSFLRGRLLLEDLLKAGLAPLGVDRPGAVAALAALRLPVLLLGVAALHSLEPPPGEDHPDVVWRLDGAFYGTRRASHLFSEYHREDKAYPDRGNYSGDVVKTTNKQNGGDIR